MKNGKKVIIMDDEIDYANFIFDVASGLGFDCTITTNPKDFMNLFSSDISLVFMDLNIPNINGLDLLKFIEEKHGKCNIILMSGLENRILETAEAFAKSIHLSIVGRFQKTIRLAELEALLTKISSSNPSTAPQSSEPKSLLITKEELISAIKHDEIVIHYQPQIDIASRGLYGVEALIRWQHPKWHLIFPDQFIHQAEALGFIDELSWIVIKKALKEIDDIQYKVAIPFKLAINLSSSTLKDLEFPPKFFKILNQYRIPATQIIFEITESSLINELSSALEIFTRLRLHDIHLSIDDFGTGYAMMQQLKIIPASEIKIDKSFVQTMFVEKSSNVTVKKVIEIGKELDMKVIAEGVETKEQLEFLQAHHCDIAQGYLFSKPIPGADLLQWIENRYRLPPN